MLVIRDTVARAVQTYESLKRRGVSAMLVHSRFTSGDRHRLDEQLISDYGPAGKRPPRVVVATQVAEQSLDVDFDLLVSDIAPIDLLLQRAGRLFRHDRPDRRVKTARILVTGATPDGAYPDGIDKVYNPWVLDQTCRVLELHSEWKLPDDIPALVEAVYSAAHDTEAGMEFLQTIKAKKAAARVDRIPPAHDPRTPDCLDGWLLGGSSYGSVREGGPVVETYLDEPVSANLLKLNDSALRYFPASGFLSYVRDERKWVDEDRNIVIPSGGLPFSIQTDRYRYEFSYDHEFGWVGRKIQD